MPGQSHIFSLFRSVAGLFVTGKPFRPRTSHPSDSPGLFIENEFDLGFICPEMSAR